MKFKFSGIFILLIVLCGFAKAQNTAVIFGKITDVNAKPVEFTVSVIGQAYYKTIGKLGAYELQLPAGKNLQVIFTSIGYKTDTLNVLLYPGEKKEYNSTLKEKVEVLGPYSFSSNKNATSTFIKINPNLVNVLPSGNEGVESLIKTLPGVSSNNELSSQYNVRGGNYDENLVYVNDIEVYRPMLVRTGEQEGLSFINPDLVSGIEFSAGGFEAKYGDKMSSVLDIQYKKPTQFAGSVSGSLLGYSAHLEGLSRNTRFSYLLGFRQKSNQYLLGSLETKGDYKPSFSDVQGCLNYLVSDKLNIDFLGNYARNVYKFIPQTRETDFGTLNDALRLTIYFDGQEVDQFNTYFGALSGNYTPKKNLLMKFIASAYQTNESETYDIQGQYWIDQLEANLGSQTFGSIAYNLGVGTFLNHARNYLNANVFNAEHKGTYVGKKCVQYWGARYQREYINDKLSEWQMVDSAGYTLPYIHDSIGYTNPSIQTPNAPQMQNVIKSVNTLSSDRVSGYYEQKWLLNADSSEISISDGIRANYWDMNRQLIVSPRATVSYKPKHHPNLLLRFSTGYYSQPPFFREMLDFNGNINRDLKAQTSIHFVLASQVDFKAWGRPFRYITEVYYKLLDNIVPYEIDNVRLQYYAKNDARGFATGIDMKVNGEFVKGIESWASLSVMKTMEDIKDDYYYTYYNKSGELIIPNYTADEVKTDSVRHNPGYIPSPTDQRVNFALFFQDFLPRNPTYKMHLTLIFGSGLPFGPPGQNRYKDTFRIPPYKRVDIGFSKELKKENSKLKPKNPFRYFKTIWFTLEVFNLLQVNNTISYIWVTDVNARQYAVPNYLTSRQLNAKIIFQF